MVLHVSRQKNLNDNTNGHSAGTCVYLNVRWKLPKQSTAQSKQRTAFGWSLTNTARELPTVCFKMI